MSAASEQLTTLVNERATAALDADSPDIVAPYSARRNTRNRPQPHQGPRPTRNQRRHQPRPRRRPPCPSTNNTPYIKATFDWMFGLGPLQDLVEEPDITDIFVTGDETYVKYPDGHYEDRDTDRRLRRPK